MRCFVIGFLIALLSAPLAAQQQSAVDPVQAARPAGESQTALVGGGPRCAPERRLVIDVRAPGVTAADRGELLTAVGLGAGAAGVAALPLDRAAAGDSALYAILEVERRADGDFRVATRLAGPRAARAPAPGACRSSATGSAGAVGFGAFVAVEAMQLTRCAQAQRGVAGP